MPSSKNSEPGSTSLAMRSRAVRRPFLCCDSMALAPPPWRICSSSFLISVRSSTMRRVFFSNSGDLRFVEVFRTEADTLCPLAFFMGCNVHSGVRQSWGRFFKYETAHRPLQTVYEVYPHRANG